MLRLPAILTTTLLLACSAKAIDFTPQYVMEYVEGVAIRRAYFADGKNNYGIKVNAETDLSAGNGGAYFKFNKFMYATMTWRMSPLSPAIPFDAEHLPTYSAAAVRLLPKGSADVKIEAQEDNVYPINHWVCHRYTISYVFFSYPMRDTVTFLNLDDKEQIVIQVSARNADFQAITAASWDIIRSWHLIEPATEKSYN